MTKNTFQGHSTHLMNPKVERDFEKVRKTICDRLKNQEIREKIIQLFSEIDSIWDDTIHSLIFEMCELLTPEIYMSIDSQLFFWQKQLWDGISSVWEISSDTFQSLQNLISPALIDIFYLICLQINSQLQEYKLKWLLYLNMRYWWSSWINNLFWTNSNIAFWEDWQESFKILRENTSIYQQDPLDISKIWKTTKDYINQTVCPFRYNNKKSEFIDNIWDFFKWEILPLLQEKFKASTDNYELFFSGNLWNKFQKK